MVQVTRLGGTPDPEAPGPLFTARYHGRCDECFEEYSEGDRIRADGQGGWECEGCADAAENGDAELLMDMRRSMGKDD